MTKCRNTKTKKAVAIKINKSKPEILQQARLELQSQETLYNYNYITLQHLDELKRLITVRAGPQ